jgi:hypothetical protein
MALHELRSLHELPSPAIVCSGRLATGNHAKTGTHAKPGQAGGAARASTFDSGLFCQFGLMTDDYTPKPAFHVYRDLIDALSR